MATSTDAPPAASLSGLTLSLERDGVRSDVLRGIDLEIARGEIVGLVGESGSGKSVLALALMGLLPHRSHPEVGGAIRVAGVDMVHGRAEELRAVRRNELGVIFQDPMTSLNPTMRIGDQVTEASGTSEESLRLLTAVGIADAELRFRVYPHELSGGLRQRVMAAIAVAGRPSLIIADEPTTALDVTVQAQVLDLLRELRDEFGCSVVLITHDLAVAGQIADRIAVLYAGRIAEVGPTGEVLHAPTHPYTVGLLRSRLSLGTPRDQELRTLRPETGTPAERMLGCAYHTRCPLAVERCRVEQPPLLDIALASAPGIGGEVALTADLPTDERLGPADHDRACWRTVDDVQGFIHDTANAAPLTSRVAPGPGREPAVRVTDLTVTFALRQNRRQRGAGSSAAREVRALRGLNLTVEPGEAVSIVGESGSGKSTLLRVIGGLTPATSGSVALAAGGAQMVFQDAGSSLTPWLTVGELLGERLAPLGLGRTENRARIDRALTSIGLPLSVARVRPAELSGGQRQRVALARATMIPPAVLLCDEPTSALDASLAASVLNLIREMRRELEMTVLFVTHDLSVARLMGDRIVVMTQGEIVEVGTSADVIERPEHPYTRRLLASVPEIGATV
ncbi:oligopeptide/dipeptide ABC transporter ATP-binding protein [Subtercola boreus]|uniref:Peptide ABC transporter ATP-binding protein n=1 Tax=Subtercola boreus TaxID=120213 RepID=A0A3E0W8N0_9MICO|nr:ABC transporter ATP-binding protein [Subtercola boreus]RFA18163.1 peptide ABC transporter ATP-binding protein [Subtercola boreus]RFA18545.1 peptide ABC transporter ATP-binding protein [Subtercola boreus]RFA25073.1 peptide ABC transporter ATP-binding protein [Subtercola boreus]